MPLDQELLEILACPQCKGDISEADSGKTLLCNRCQLKYPVRDGIPVMLIEEAMDLKKTLHLDEKSVKLPRVTFRVSKGPDTNMTFQIEESTCRTIGRAMGDPHKTSVFNVDISMALDESTKGLVMKYISRQFQDAKVRGGEGEHLGGFRRTSDVTLTDPSLSRLHAMFFSYGGRVGILDLVSKNGTYVNGQEIESAMLDKGDIVEVGETTIVFEG